MTRPEVIETHISVLFSLGDRVYKLKKPVDLGFVDFTDRAVRRRTCEREVELNARFAPDVYLGVADVIGPDGEPCDHLVVMRRMPAARRLATLVSGGEDVDAALRDVARQLAIVHAGSVSSVGDVSDVDRRGRRLSLDRQRRPVAAVRRPVHR